MQEQLPRHEEHEVLLFVHILSFVVTKIPKPDGATCPVRNVYR